MDRLARVPAVSVDRPFPERDGTVESAFCRGHETALRTAYDRYSGLIYRFGLVALHDHHDAEELVQQVFIRAWNASASFDPAKGSLWGWLHAISRRQIADRLVERGRGHRLTLAVSEQQVRTEPEPVPEHLVDRIVVADGINRLPPEQRTVIRMALFHGLSHSEIAQTAGMPIGTVKSLIRRGLIRLRGMWEVRNDSS